MTSQARVGAHPCPRAALPSTPRYQPLLLVVSWAVQTLVASAALPALAQSHLPTALGLGSTSGSQAHSTQPRSAQLSANAQVVRIAVEVANPGQPADGQSVLEVVVRVYGANDQLLEQDVTLTIEHSAGRIQLPGAGTDELGPRSNDADRSTPGVQLVARGGQARFLLLAPAQAQSVKLKVSAGATMAEGEIDFVPELREWISAGLIEGVISLRRSTGESSITPVRTRDGFDEALNQWSRNFNSGSANKGTAAARAAFFVRGTIKGETLLTAAYDSDKETRARMLRDIRPEEIYPVYGDASIKAFEARSSGKLFVRVDNGKHYALFGDFQTGSGFTNTLGQGGVAPPQARDLGSVNRSLTGLRLHFESPAATPGEHPVLFNFYAARDSLVQRVEEYAGVGTSGPFSVARIDAVYGTEKVEIIVRDRNNPGLVLEQQPLQALIDYSFDPFSGRLLLKGPLMSTDERGNPQSLRVSYEVESGGERFWVAGSDGQLRVSPGIDIGSSLYINKDPSPVLSAGERKLTGLASVNAGFRLGQSTHLVIEAARSEVQRNTGEFAGRALRAQLQASSGPGQEWALLVRVAQANKLFYNPAASLNEGRAEAVVEGRYKLTPSLTLRAQAQANEDANTGAKRKAAMAGVDARVNEQLHVSAGLRWTRDNGAGLYANTSLAGVSSLYSSSQAGLVPQGGGLFGSGTGLGVDPGTGQVPQMATETGAGLNTTTLSLGLRYKPRQDLSVGLEAENAVRGDNAWRAAATAQWALSERTRLNARYETQTGLGSEADRSARANAFVLGVNNRYNLQGLGAGENGLSGELFSEYRLRDAVGAREGQLATGLRNTFDIAAGWRAVLGVERLHALTGTRQNSASLATGLDYIGSELWKGSGRLEWRHTEAKDAAPGATALLGTVTLARKMSRDWTLLARHYFASTDTQLTPGTQSQNRFQIGAAYRPVDNNRVDALGKLEWRTEHNGELAMPEQRRVAVASLQTNWHPARPWWLSGRVAAKLGRETLNVADSGVTSDFRATLLGARLIYDISENWDLGLAANALRDNLGSVQKASGFEVGYALKQNLWLSAGYNVSGFTDRDLTGAEYTSKGPYLRLRFKFDEDLFRSANRAANPTLDPQPHR
jgi:hypothetical protein